MPDRDDKPPAKPKPTVASDRETRLAAALRANLRRRKARPAAKAKPAD
jgi:hypothetical protein